MKLNLVRLQGWMDFRWNVFAFNSDINNVHPSVNRELVGVENCLKANRLSLNVS